MNLKFVDAHTHAQFPVYDSDREAVIRRAEENNVQMVCVGTQTATSASAIVLAKQYPKQIWATVGFHPSHADLPPTQSCVGGEHGYHDESEQKENKKEVFNFGMLEKLANDPQVVAIGECGLDYYRLPGDRQQELKEKQKEIFTKQIELAGAVRKPLMIYCRNAFSDLIAILLRQLADCNFAILQSNSPGIIHFFTGRKEDAQALLDLGFSFTFGGVITFARDYDEIIKMIPLDRILSETDAPYVAPAPYRGKRNEPAYVVEVVKKLAEIKDISVEKMAEQILQTARKIFSIA